MVSTYQINQISKEFSLYYIDWKKNLLKLYRLSGLKASMIRYARIKDYFGDISRAPNLIETTKNGFIQRPKGEKPRQVNTAVSQRFFSKKATLNSSKYFSLQMNIQAIPYSTQQARIAKNVKKPQTLVVIRLAIEN